MTTTDQTMNTTRKPRRTARPPEPVAETAPRTTKINVVVDLLRRGHGARLADIVEATGWHPHTARAALTGLKKKGHVIRSTTADKVTCYKLA